MNKDRDPHVDDLTSAGDASRPGDRRAFKGSDLTRRQLMTYGGQGLAILGAGSLLAACGSSTSSSGSTTAGGTTSVGGGKPVKGGKINIGMITGGSAETVDPGIAVSYSDQLRVAQLYDFLFQSGPGDEFHKLEPRLATSAEPNKDATVWTFKLREGVTWHDGKPFDADDVIWTIQSWSKPTNYAGAYAAAFIDFKKVRKLDKYTVEIPMIQPAAQFPTVTTLWNLAVIQKGATPADLAKNPIGTGPFKFVSFKPGSQSVFVRNDNYWEGNGKPYLDEVVVNTTFQDETSRYNALVGGEIDVSPLFPGNYARQQQSSQQVNVLNSPSGQAYAFTMRVDKGPFADVRVRQAMKLMCDRQALIDGTFPGYAQPGNDVEGRFGQYFASDIKPEFDVEKAKALLKEAGQENLSLTLPTAGAYPGFVESATLFAQQAEGAGVKINVEQVSAATYFTEPGGYLTRPFGQVNSNTWPSLSVVAATSFTSNSAYPEIGWAEQPGGGNQALLKQAMGELDPTKAQDLWHEVQAEWAEKGGYLVWGFVDNIDAAGKKVAGLTAGIANPLNNFRLLDAWLTS
jgi:peptide/nickel transport system substrate-binding protein